MRSRMAGDKLRRRCHPRPRRSRRDTAYKTSAFGIISNCQAQTPVQQFGARFRNSGCTQQNLLRRDSRGLMISH